MAFLLFSIRQCENSRHLLVIFFGKIADFINFDADDVDDGGINKCGPAAQTVSDNEFIDDEIQIDKNIDYYAFTNVCGSVQDAMQGSFLESYSR